MGEILTECDIPPRSILVFLQGIHACLKEMKGKPANRRKKHQSGDEPGGCHKNPLTTHAQYGLMRPVARIAQSVEQGIENPCVLGSIPSPGTIFKETRLWRVFCFLRCGLSIELRSIIRLILRLTPAGSAQALLKDAARLCPSPGTLFKETRLWRVFCFLRFMAFALRNNTISPVMPSPWS